MAIHLVQETELTGLVKWSAHARSPAIKWFITTMRLIFTLETVNWPIMIVAVVVIFQIYLFWTLVAEFIQHIGQIECRYSRTNWKTWVVKNKVLNFPNLPHGGKHVGGELTGRGFVHERYRSENTFFNWNTRISFIPTLSSQLVQPDASERNRAESLTSVKFRQICSFMQQLTTGPPPVVAGYGITRRESLLSTQDSLMHL